MMYGGEKSDSAIVAGKPTNKAVLTAAESVERRAEAKGNASQQSTDRAQNRAAASQPLARIRKVAKVVTGYFNYHAVPTNGPTLAAFRFHVIHLWRRTLRRRSQKDWTTMDRTARL